MIRYFLGISVISLALILVFLTALAELLQLHGFFGWVVVFYFFQSLLVSWVLVAGEADKSRFALYALGAVSLRLITAIFFMLSLLVAGLEDLQNLIIQFTIVYLFYFAFEMIMVFRNLRPNSEKNLSR